MNTNDPNDNIDDNFADVSFDGLHDPNAEIEARRSEAQKERDLELTRRKDPFTWTIPAHKLADGDWLAGPAPTPRKALLEHPTSNDDNAGKLYMPAGKAGMLVAPGGTGKTTVLMQLAISVATGLPWLGHYDVAQQGRVLVALGEEDQTEMQRSLYYAAKAAGIKAGDDDRYRKAIYQNIVAYPLAGVPVPFVDADGNRLEFFHRLADYIEETGPYSLVILDPGSRFMGPDAETDNAAATQFVQCLEALTQTQGAPAVLMAHHTNKTALGEQGSSQGDARGSSALVDGVRWVVNLRSAIQPIEGAGLRTTLEVTKTNYGPAGKALELIRKEYGWRAMTAGEVSADAAARKKQEIDASADKAKIAKEGRKQAKTDAEGMI